MDFARKQLLKYGWKEGEGIGREGNQGINIPIKPKYKRGREGMGFDLSKDLVDTWWTRSYTESLARIHINPVTIADTQPLDDEDEGVRVTFQQDDSGGDEFSKMRRRMMSSSFQEFSKGAVLDNGMMVEENSDSDADSGIVTPGSSCSSKILTDEELFKACGGRTAHKTARFGHTLSGKLGRIAAQEEEALLAFQNDSTQEVISATSKSRKGKTKRKHLMDAEIISTDVSPVERKRKKKGAIEGMIITEQVTFEEENVGEEMEHEPSFGEDSEKRRKRKKGSKKERH